MKGLCQRMLFPVLFLAAFAASVGLTRPTTASTDTIEIERGRYLVEEVAKCPECHTPRNARGELDHQAGYRVRRSGSCRYRQSPIGLTALRPWRGSPVLQKNRANEYWKRE
jgi:hypothetical protein